MNTTTEHDSSYIRTCWEHFIHYDSDADYSGIRPEILESWERSREHSLNPMEISHVRLTPSEIHQRIQQCLPLLQVSVPIWNSFTAL